MVINLRLWCVLSLFALCALPAHAWAQGIVDTLPRVKPSVVGIGTHHPIRTPRVQLAGTGFVVGDGLTVATNAHVIARELDTARRETLAVLIPRGEQVEVRPAERIAADATHDLVLLRIQGEPLPALALGDSDRVREGQTLYFTGYPLGAALGLHPATHRAGLAAVAPIYTPPPTASRLTPQLIRRAEDRYVIFQLDAIAYPGNSGSPLYDPDTGQVLGIVNSVFVKGAKENALKDPSGIAYAIPVNPLKALIERSIRRP
ncbi:MAG: serine protease [Thiobacillaceae bacterium]|nr:serine protease [Thiobacillaceae bacterium]MDW8323111.1 serine protease [Burkholderiales bacterium]